MECPGSPVTYCLTIDDAESAKHNPVMIKLKRSVLLAAALLAAACNLNTIPPTPRATETPTQPPLPTATATLAPTPTIEPAITLKQGAQDALAGHFDSAANTYARLVDQAGASDQERATAALGVGQAAVQTGSFADAVDALTTFIDQFPQDSRIAQAHYLRGEANLGLSRWNDAINDFQAYLSLKPGLIDGYANEEIGNALLAVGQPAAALASYNKAAGDPNMTPQASLALRERIAQIEASSGDSADAVAQYDALGKATQDKAYAAHVAFAAAQTLIQAGDLQNGLVRMAQVFSSYPDQPEAYQAMNILLQNNVGLDNLIMGTVCYNEGDYLGAIKALSAYARDHTFDTVPTSMLLMLGRAYREIGNTQAANTTFETIITQYPTDSLFGQALLEQGESFATANDLNSAIEQYMNIADNYNYVPEVPEALLRAGLLYEQAKQPQTARAVFEKLADGHPGTPQAIEGLFQAAALAYSAGDFTAAERYYGEISVKTTGDDQATAYFWVGALALKRGDQKTAGEAFAQVVLAAPDSYFAMRAKDLIEGITPFAPPKQTQFQFDDAAQIAQAEDWLRKTYNLTQTGSLAALAPDLQSDPLLARGLELWNVGDYADATAEFDALVNANEGNGLASYQLAVYFQNLGAYEDSILAASYVVRDADVGTLDAPLYIARLRYPADYVDTVQQIGQQYSIDPLLLLALIRYESLFNTHVIGSADEQGLLQIAPGMAAYIAQQLQWPQDQSDLSRPYAGITFGAYGLSEQLQRFQNNVPVALAAYEAGSGRAQAWLDASGGDTDQFMTAADANTRSFIQSIYSYYTIYRALYGTG
ncbi:MAG TPA: tetratricopeptide repeat protein [Phototrophicaceae bacterium]|nr:tetratricopeptide repeat protein [Phototrophicaceae bacterium]